MGSSLLPVQLDTLYRKSIFTFLPQLKLCVLWNAFGELLRLNTHFTVWDDRFFSSSPGKKIWEEREKDKGKRERQDK